MSQHTPQRTVLLQHFCGSSAQICAYDEQALRLLVQYYIHWYDDQLFYFAVSVSIFRFPSLCGERERERDLERERERWWGQLAPLQRKRKQRGGPGSQTYTPCKGFHACMFCSLLQQPGQAPSTSIRLLSHAHIIATIPICSSISLL